MLTANATYQRSPVPADKMGQCPCCLRAHRATKNGTLIRHGWQETGRQVGQFGCGFQWGNCRGWGKRPLEQTDADAQVILAELTQELAAARASREHHATNGEERYPATHVERYDLTEERLASLERELASAFPDVVVTTSRERREGRRVHYATVATFEVPVKRGHVGFKKQNGYCWVTIPSYDELRDALVRELDRLIESLERQRDGIQEAVTHHRENPSNGMEDTVKRGPVTHWAVERERFDYAKNKRVKVSALACGSRTFAARKSAELAEVTCSRCLKRSKRPADD